MFAASIRTPSSRGGHVRPSPTARWATCAIRAPIAQSEEKNTEQETERSGRAARRERKRAKPEDLIGSNMNPDRAETTNRDSQRHDVTGCRSPEST